MKLDTRKKLDRVKRFFANIKQTPGIEPFLATEEIPRFGIYDFHYISPEVIYFSSIQKKLKENKYTLLDDFVKDMRTVFISVSDYVFQDDDFQRNCNDFKEKVGDFRNEMIREFTKKQSQENDEFQKKLVWVQPQNENSEEMGLTKEQKKEIHDKLQLLFTMQTFQSNLYGVKYLGNLCGIVNEKSENNFAIEVDIHSNFMSTYLQHHTKD